jgi:hypothetical protein
MKKSEKIPVLLFFYPLLIYVIKLRCNCCLLRLYLIRNPCMFHRAGSGGNKGGSTSGVNALEPEEMGPKPRNRSCSYNEASKPVGIQRRVTHATGKCSYFIFLYLMFKPDAFQYYYHVPL